MVLELVDKRARQRRGWRRDAPEVAFAHVPRDDDAHARHLVPVPPLLEPVVEARLAAAHVEERVDEVGQPRAAPLQRKRVRGDRGAKAEREGHEADEDGEEEAPVARLELAPRRRRPVRRRGRQEVSRRDVAVARVAACRIARAEVAELELLLREQALPRQPLWSIGSRQTAPQGKGQPRDDSAASTAAMYRPSIAWLPRFASFLIPFSCRDHDWWPGAGRRREGDEHVCPDPSKGHLHGIESYHLR